MTTTQNSRQKRIEKREFTQQEKNKIVEKLITARVGLLLRHPFFGNLATRLQMIDATDWLSTIATDGRKFYYNLDFVNRLTPKQAEFGFAHEVLHNILDHIGRRRDRDPVLSNIAADFAANQILKDEKIGEIPDFIKIYQDNKYRGWSYEQIYDDLLEKAEKIDLSMLGDLLDDHLDGDGDDDASAAGNGKSESESPSQNFKDYNKGYQDGYDDAKNNNPAGANQKSNGSAAYNNGYQNGFADAKAGKSNDQKNGRPKLTAEEKKAIRDEIKEAMVAAAQSAGAGRVPAAIQRMIKDLTEPKMDWRQLLRMNIQSIVKSNFSFQRPNRKSQHCGAILPGMMNEETIDVSIAIDMSGSISDKQASDFLSEVKGIMDEYKDFKLDLWCFDTSVYNYTRFTGDNADEITSYEPKGGGGTDFDINFHFMKENDITPKKFIMFTDGYPCGSWGDEDYTDTLFIIHGNDSIVPPFGQVAYYSEK